jgi:hypothetical protein
MRLWLVLVILSLAIDASAASPKEQVLYSFQGGADGLRPIGGVVFDKAGNLYGVTVNGGSNTCRGPFDCGTVYQLKPPIKQGDPWTETVLYIFKGTDHNDGASPFGGLIFDAAGNLYGTTGYDGTGPCQLFGGQAGCGTVFKLSPPTAPGGSWTETVLYNFQGDKDGQFPMGNLLFDGSGNLYGATYYGGGFGSCNDPFFQHCGTIFELSPPKKKGGKWTEKVLYSFKNGQDGANPNGSLVFDKKGALYGTAYFGGKEDGDCRGGSGQTGCGTVFKLNAPVTKGGMWTFEVLHIFQRGSGDGAYPNAGVTLDKHGNPFGTTFSGPTGALGTVFELRQPSGQSLAWKEAVLHKFTDGNDGENPMGSLSFSPSGDLYGTTMVSSSKLGSLFRMRRQGGAWKLDVVYSFVGPPDGRLPDSTLVLDKLGNIYSTTPEGGTGTGQGCQFGCGTVFEVTP